LRTKWILALSALLAVGLIAAGCGDDDDSSDSTTTTSTAEDTSGSSDSSDSSGGATAEDVYTACQDAIAGTPAESAGEAGCAAARDAFEQCATQAENLDSAAKETAIKACQDTADAAVKALQAGS
jgi:hypothetical protein